MVATVVKLRFRALANNLARNPWQLVGFIFGVIWACGALFTAFAGAMGLVTFGMQDVARVVAVLGGSLLVLGWALGPVLVAGMDSTVDAERLAPFPLTQSDVQRSLFAVSATGVAGIATTLVALVSIILWLPNPVAAVVAAPMALLGVITCVVAARFTTTLAAGLGANRRWREASGTLLLMVAIFIGPILAGVTLVFSQGGDLAQRFGQIAGVVGWTPLGAAWAVPGDVADGQWLALLGRVILAVAVVSLLWWGWGRALARSVVAGRGGGGRVKVEGLGWFGRTPATPVGGTFARAITAWLRDPRYSRQLLLVPLFPVVMALVPSMDGWPLRLSAVIVALVLVLATYTDVSYDGTGFALVLATGIRGRDDRAGRMLAAAAIGIPALLVVAIVVAAVTQGFDLLPVTLGVGFAVLLGGYGVTAVSSALLVTPVPQAGDNPFKSVPGQTFVSGLMVFVVLAAIGVVGLPAMILAGVSLVTGSALWSWVTLAVGVLGGAALAYAGVIVGGRIFDRNAPALLARIRAFPR